MNRRNSKASSDLPQEQSVQVFHLSLSLCLSSTLFHDKRDVSTTGGPFLPQTATLPGAGDLNICKTGDMSSNYRCQIFTYSLPCNPRLRELAQLQNGRDPLEIQWALGCRLASGRLSHRDFTSYTSCIITPMQKRLCFLSHSRKRLGFSRDLDGGNKSSQRPLCIRLAL